MNNVTFELATHDIDAVNGGIICGGACVLGAIAIGIGLFSSGVTIGSALR